jgi:hypothetical protein
MEPDIRKLADWIEKATRETIAIERKILEWKLAEKSAVVKVAAPEAKAS